MPPLTSYSVSLVALLLISTGAPHAQTQIQDQTQPQNQTKPQGSANDPRYVEGSGLRTAVDDDYGLHVVLDDGRPVYVMVTDQAHGDGLAPLDSCYDRCLEEWPLVTVRGDVQDLQLGEGMDPALVDVSDWEDEQVLLYSGQPLFLFFRDEPGQPPAGQEIFSFGGYWALISPQGEPIRTGIVPEADRN